jgi:broad specificity phosphatase PhoE
MRIILVRHGETVDNIKGVTQGWVHGKLTARGRKQAKLLAKELKKYKIDAIYSSDLGRAADTAKIIAKFHKNVPILYAKEMREINKGVFQGRPREEAKEAREKSGMPRHKWRPRGGESWEDVQKRVQRFLTMIKKKHKNDTVLFAGHGRVNAIVLYTLARVPLRNRNKFKISPNASINIIEINKHGKAKIKLLDYTGHLD